MPFIGLLYKKSEKGAVYAETMKMQKSLSFPECFRIPSGRWYREKHTDCSDSG